MSVKKKLCWRLLGIIIPFIVFVFIAFIGVYEWVSYNVDKNKLNSKLEDLSSTYSRLLAEPVSRQNLKDIQLYNISLIADPDVAYVVIRNSEGDILEKYGEVKESTSLQRKVNINYFNNDAIKKVGDIELALTTQTIFNKLVKRIKYEVFLLFSLILVVFAAVCIAYAKTIGNPLKALMHSINYYKKHRKHIKVTYNKNDELGTIIQRFNDMQEHQLKIQQELKNQYFFLEKTVAERTLELEQELAKHAETSSKLYKEKQRAQVTINSISDSVITTDEKGVIEFMNPAAHDLISCQPGETIGKKFSQVFQLLSIDSRDPEIDLVSWCLQSSSKHSPPVEFNLKIASGKEFIIELVSTGLFDVNGKANGVVILIRDITKNKKHTNELSYLARHDMLTGLVNRREFETRMQNLLEDARLSERQHAMFYLDLDHFKIVNDECGHAAGDKVLKLLSEEFKRHLRKEDCIGRLGGDEFGVLLVNCNIKSAQLVGEKMRHDIDTFEFQWHDKIYKLGVSIGIVAITQHADSIEMLIAEADAGCYQAKQKGRNRIHLHTVN